MTDNPNIKREILDFAIRETVEGDEDVVRIYDFADESGYNLSRCAKKVNEMYPIFEYGVSPRVPWLHDLDAAREAYEDWGVEPPEAIQNDD